MPSHYLSAVGEFHRAVGVDRLATLTQREQLVMVALRATLIAEEAQEYQEALERLADNRSTTHLQHAAKEAADLLYVVVGTADVLGMIADTPALSLHFPGSVESTFMWDTVLKAQLRILNDQLTDLGRMIHYGDDTTDVIDDIINDLHYVVRSLRISAKRHGIPLDEAFVAVHASNMSKIDTETGQPFERREDGKVLKGPHYREADLSWLVAA
jgi:predicted HAD superfamily Cof-like phosphohydrolase